MKQGVALSIGIIALTTALAMMQFTTPHLVGPLGVLAFFICVYIACACMIYIGLFHGLRLARKVLPKGALALAISGMKEIKLYYFASFLALAPVILLGMRSVGEIRLIDAGLLVIFQVLGCFYISRRF